MQQRLAELVENERRVQRGNDIPPADQQRRRLDGNELFQLFLRQHRLREVREEPCAPVVALEAESRLEVDDVLQEDGHAARQQSHLQKTVVVQDEIVLFLESPRDVDPFRGIRKRVHARKHLVGRETEKKQVLLRPDVRPDGPETQPLDAIDGHGLFGSERPLELDAEHPEGALVLIREGSRGETPQHRLEGFLHRRGDVGMNGSLADSSACRHGDEGKRVEDRLDVFEPQLFGRVTGQGAPGKDCLRQFRNIVDATHKILGFGRPREQCIGRVERGSRGEGRRGNDTECEKNDPETSDIPPHSYPPPWIFGSP